MFALPLLLILTSLLSPEVAPHKFHVTYSRIAIEGNTVVARVRFFSDDLGTALGKELKQENYRVTASAEQDSLFLAYFDRHFILTDGDSTLDGILMGSGEEMEGKEPMWWYLIQFEAEKPLSKLHITNKLLTEAFEDQKNIVQIQHFPSEKTWSLYFVDDDLDYLIEFDS
jgi:hypothetical protein